MGSYGHGSQMGGYAQGMSLPNEVYRGTIDLLLPVFNNWDSFNWCMIQALALVFNEST